MRDLNIDILFIIIGLKLHSHHMEYNQNRHEAYLRNTNYDFHRVNVSGY